MLLVYNSECGTSSITSTKKYLRDTSLLGIPYQCSCKTSSKGDFFYRSTFYHVEEYNCRQHACMSSPQVQPVYSQKNMCIRPDDPNGHLFCQLKFKSNTQRTGSSFSLQYGNSQTLNRNVRNMSLSNRLRIHTYLYFELFLS